MPRSPVARRTFPSLKITLNTAETACKTIESMRADVRQLQQTSSKKGDAMNLFNTISAQQSPTVDARCYYPVFSMPMITGDTAEMSAPSDNMFVCEIVSTINCLISPPAHRVSLCEIGVHALRRQNSDADELVFYCSLI